MIDLDLIETRFKENFEKRGELGAAVSIWKNGEEIISLANGWTTREKTTPWTSDTLIPVWSATKGPAAVTTLKALQDAGISPLEKVSTLWPELKAARESDLSFSALLAHQSGLPALSPDNRPNTLDRKAVCHALENQPPFWEPGTAHGYHPRTIGFLLDEIVRRVSGGVSLGTYWKEKIAAPLNIDFHIGKLPPGAIDRLATIYPPRLQQPAQEEIPFYRALGENNPESLSLAAFSSPTGVRALSDINKLEILQAAIPSFGGIGSARSLAKFYSSLIANKQGVVIPQISKSIPSHPISSGNDLTLLLPTRFSAGFMLDPLDLVGNKTRHIFGPSVSAFGQHGAGGSHAFADPETGITFAYVMNQMKSGILPNEKSLQLVSALFQQSPT